MSSQKASSPELMALIEALDKLTDEQRLEIFRRYCIHCGAVQPEDRYCYCSNDL